MNLLSALWGRGGCFPDCFSGEEILFCSFNLCWLPAGNGTQGKFWIKGRCWFSQWKQEVVACVLQGLEESKRQRKNSLNRSGRSRREPGGSRGGMGRAEGRMEATKPTDGRLWVSWWGWLYRKRIIALCCKEQGRAVTMSQSYCGLLIILLYSITLF